MKVNKVESKHEIYCRTGEKKILNTQEIFAPTNIYLYFTTIRGKCWGTKCFERMQEGMTSVKLEEEGLSRQLVDMQRQQAGKTRELRETGKG